MEAESESHAEPESESEYESESVSEYESESEEEVEEYAPKTKPKARYVKAQQYSSQFVNPLLGRNYDYSDPSQIKFRFS